MKASVHERFGSPDVLELGDIELPAVTDDDVPVRIRAPTCFLEEGHARGEVVIRV